MTREEAIDILKHDISADKQGIEYCHNELGIEALEMAIKALEQEPKTGHWDRRACKCSECGYQITFSEYTEHKYKYCPNCGTRMESEDKE